MIPFNPTTKIQFQLPEATHVNIAVYNVMGQKVATLVNNQMVSGHHEVEWNASMQASGVYIYQIQTGSFTATRRMFLVK